MHLQEGDWFLLRAKLRGTFGGSRDRLDTPKSRSNRTCRTTQYRNLTVPEIWVEQDQ